MRDPHAGPLLIRVAALSTAALGVIVLAGWMFDLPLLKSALPGAVEMKANTAVALVLAGCALFVLGERPPLPRQHLAQTMALAVGALGLATLGQYLFGWQLGIDELLFSDAAGANFSNRGRMSPYSAAAFAGLGLALAVLPRPGLRPLVWLGAVPVVIIGAVSLVGYLWNARELVTDQMLPPVAVHTALAFIVLGAGTLLARSRPEAPSAARPAVLGSMERKVLAGFVGALLLLIVAGGMTYRETLAYADSARLVAHAQEVRAALGGIYASVADAETAQRDYLITGQRRLLERYADLRVKAQELQESLAHLVADDSEQTTNTGVLGLLKDYRFELLARGITLYQVGGFALARSVIAEGEGDAAMQALRDHLARMDGVEAKLLAEREGTLTRSGQRTLALLLFTLLAAAAGFALLYRGIRREIGMRNVAERERAAAERRLLDMAESLPGAIYQRRLKPDGSSRFEFLSGSVTQLFGFDRQALLRDPVRFWDAVVEADKPDFEAALKKSARMLEPQQHDFRIRHQADGADRWLRSSATLRKEADGSILWNGYWSDVTEQKRLQLALQESKLAADSANRAKSTFLATMSHEIRTPMNGVLGMLELLSLTRLDGEQRTTLEVVRESGKSLLRIIDDILDFSKIEAGKLEVRPEVASIAEAVEGVHNIYLGNASSKGLLVKRSVDPRISPAVLVDPLRLRQILNNFVSNAIKFTAQGHIEIKAALIERTDGEDRVRFSVTDTGIGIALENQQRLFQPFTQAEAGTAQKFGGTGLGLAICKRLAEMMGGTVEMTSELGKGTTMVLTLSLPVADPKALRKTDPAGTPQAFDSSTRMRRMAPSVAAAEAEGTLVLLVDDHPTNRALLERQLKLLGYAAERAENGLEALEKWQSHRFGIVLTDCNMPEMDGYELARRIRKLEAANGGTRTPIIACTANALGGEAEICFAAGMDDYLAKPVNLKALLKKLDQWLPVPKVTGTAAATPGKPPEAGASGVAAAAPIDRSALSQITAGDASTERDILIDFRRVNDEDAQMLKRAVAASDLPQLTRAAHRIKGACRMVGALVLADVCERLEAASRARDWSAITLDLGAFERELSRLNAYFDEETQC